MRKINHPASSHRDKAIAELIQQVEWALGPIDTTPCVVEGDDDKSILEHNFRCVLDRLIQVIEAENY